MKKIWDHKGTLVLAVVAVAAGITGASALYGFSGNGRVAYAEDNESEPESAPVQYENGWESAERDTEYVYCVGSVSKIYSTAAVMRLVDEGKVKPDSPVTDYIPEFRMVDPRYRDITVRMLMDHTSGLMGSVYAEGQLYEDADEERLNRLPEYLAGQRLKADPGEYASYCNDGFDLLAIIVERVSGMDFTEYVRKYLAAPTGGNSTGSGVTCLSMEDLAPAYTVGHNRYELCSTQVLGAGGIYATASDTAKFGAGFFKGNDSILTEESRTAMATRWSDEDIYMDENGLGWDFVSMDRYEDAGVSVLGKGGDSGMDHAFLMVAPREEISVAVLSNGGSSALNGIMAEAVMDVCLEEQGIHTGESEWPAAGIVTVIPEEYDHLAGSYAVSNGTGYTIDRITFPENKYMHVESIGPYRRACTDYALTKDGRFAELAYEVEDSGVDEMKAALNPTYISFNTMADGQIYIAADVNTQFPGMGSHAQHFYIGEKLGDEPESADTAAFADEAAFAGATAGREFVLVSERPSSGGYDTPFVEVVQPSDYPGYVFFVNDAMGTELLKIEDATHARAFTTIPSSRNRDLMDITLKEDGDGLKLVTSNGLEFLSDADIPVFGGSQGEITMESDRPAWFKIGRGAVGAETAIAERPEHSAVYVYNKFGEVVYSTHVIGITDILPMPEDGRIVFLGNPGGRFTME